MVPKYALLGLGFLLIVGIVLYFVFSPSGYENYQDLLTLEYGDSCSYLAERRRINITKLTLSLHFDQKDELGMILGQLLVIPSLFSPLVQEGVPLCNDNLLLTCNRETETCGCGEPSFLAIFGEGVAGEMSSRYVSERGASFYQKRNCKWRRGNYCVPSYYSDGSEEEDKCTASTSCRVTGQRRKPCTPEVLSEHLKGSTNRLEFFMDLIQGSICSCQADDPAIAVLQILT